MTLILLLCTAVGFLCGYLFALIQVTKRQIRKIRELSADCTPRQPKLHANGYSWNQATKQWDWQEREDE